MINEENFKRPVFIDSSGSSNLAVDGSENPIQFKLHIPEGFEYHLTDLKYRVFIDLDEHLDIRHEFQGDKFFEKGIKNGLRFGFYCGGKEFYGEDVRDMDDFAWNIGQIESTFSFDRGNKERRYYFQSKISSTILSKNGANLIITVRDNFSYFKFIEIEAMGDLFRIKK